MRIKALDSVRGIAALIVVAAHIFHLMFFQRNPLELEADYTPLELLINGRFAVIMFFVLSGFVLTGPIINNQGHFDYTGFVIKRALRIYLPYLVVILASWALYDLVMMSNPQPTAWHEWAAPTHLLSAAGTLLMAGFNDNTLLDVATWTLVIEMQVAFILPLVVFLLFRYKLWALVGWILFSLIAGKLFVRVEGNVAMFTAKFFAGRIALTAYYVQYFAIGSFIAINADRIRRIVSATPSLVHISVLLLFVLLPYKFYSSHYSAIDMLYAVIASFVIVYCLYFPAVSRALSGNLLQWLGSRSYSLYLVHLPLLFAAAYIMTRYVPLYMAILTVLPVIFLTAEVVHRFVEVPAIDIGRKLASRALARTVSS